MTRQNAKTITWGDFSGASWIIAASFCLALSACGGGSDSSAGTDNRHVTGAAVKGPFRDADIFIYAHDATGETLADLGTTRTDENGNFTTDSVPPGATAIIGVQNGSFLDESDPVGLRSITWPNTEFLLSFIPANLNAVAITPLSDQLVRKSRRDSTTGRDFSDAMTENRVQAVRAFGFDPLTVIPPNPINPAFGSSQQQLQYALYLGGVAMAVNSAALQLGLAAPDFDLLHAMLIDLEDCVLDGRDFGATLFVNDEPLPNNINLANEVQRFRNNNADNYGAVSPPVINQTLCGNALPFAGDNAESTAEATLVSINVLSNDVDPDGSVVATTLEIVDASSDGLAVVNAGTGQIEFTPADGFIGDATFTYRVQDNLGAYTNTATVTVTVGAGSTCVPPPADMVAWFTGDADHTQDPSTYDIQGGLTGDLRNGAIGGLVAGQVAEALSFDGANDALQIDGLAGFNAPQLTMEAWVNLSSIPASGGAIFTKRRHGGFGSFEGIHLAVNNAGTFRAAAFSGANTVQQTGSTTVVEPGTWYHVAFSFDGNRLRLYVNGVLEGQGPAGGAAIEYNPSHPVFIGNNHTTGSDPGFPRRFPGLIDELALFDRALSDAEIAAIYDAGPLGKCKPENTSDADGDGLSFSDELSLGTSPNNADTDGDGLTDGEEVNETGTDPTQADIDGDGVGDAIEVFYGTDPEQTNPTVYVSPNGNNANDGLSWATAKRDNATLNGAPARIDALSGAANKPVYVLYEGGSYTPLVVPQDFDIIFVGSVGPGFYTPVWPPTTLFDGALGGRALEVIGNSATTLRFRNIELTRGRVLGEGGAGALLREGAVPGFTRVFFDQMVIRKNNAYGLGNAQGGGLYAHLDAFTMSDSLIQENFANFDGGGVSVGGVDSTYLFQRNVFAANEAGNRGGGVYATGDVPRILHLVGNQILSNHASGANSSGGALYYQSSDPAGTSLLVSNNLIIGNAASTNEADAAGAIVINGGFGGGTTAVALKHNTIAYNQMVNDKNKPGGVFIDNANNVFPELSNNIIWYNDDETVSAAPEKPVGGGAGSPKDDDNVLLTLNAVPGNGADNNINASNNGNSGVRAPPNNEPVFNPLFESGFYLNASSLLVDLSSSTAAAAGLTAPYTTRIDGAGDTGQLDLGFHYRQSALGVADSIQLEPQPYVSDFNEVTVVFTPTTSGQPIGSGHLVGACLTGSLPADVTLFSLTTLEPFVDCSGEQVLAIDMGDGRYAFKLQSDSDQTINAIDFDIYLDQVPTVLPIVVDVVFDIGA